jgi:ribosomal protein S21
MVSPASPFLGIGIFALRCIAVLSRIRVPLFATGLEDRLSCHQSKSEKTNPSTSHCDVSGSCEKAGILSEVRRREFYENRRQSASVRPPLRSNAIKEAATRITALRAQFLNPAMSDLNGRIGKPPRLQ